MGEQPAQQPRRHRGSGEAASRAARDQLLAAAGQRPDEFARRLQPLAGADGKHGLQQPDHRLGHPGRGQLSHRQRPAGLLRMDFVQVVARERGPAAKQIPQSDPERVNVRRRVDAPVPRPRELLRTRVGRRAHEPVAGVIGPEKRPGAHRLGQAPVDDLDQVRCARPGNDHEVGRLEVAVHHPAGFRRLQGTGDLQPEVEGGRHAEGPFPPQPGLERFALDQLHGVKAFPVLFAVEGHRRDVGMGEAGRHARLTQETRPGGRVPGHGTVDDLQGHGGFEHGVARPVGRSGGP